MNILINCSNLKKGGGLQVADSICGCLTKVPNHNYLIVLSSYMDNTAHNISGYDHIEIIRYDITNNWKTILYGRDDFLDNIVESKDIYVVLTIFGPARWSPRCKHLCGFARAQILPMESPYLSSFSFIERIHSCFRNIILKFLFGRGVDAFWTENPYISKKVRSIYPNYRVFTVTNYYNQVFDQVDMQREYVLPPFTGCSLLSVNAPYEHKNLAIAIDVARYLQDKYPSFQFRFVFTVNVTDLPQIPNDLKGHFCLIGKVDISECPSLYNQCNIMFQPTLLECFTATYPEAMKSGLPIITTDLPFAIGLCGDAAIYYPALDAKACAESIYKLANDKEMQILLITKGKEELGKFDNYRERANKLIDFATSL